MVNVIFAAKKGNLHHFSSNSYAVADTIIQLDSIKNRSLFKNKKNSSKKPPATKPKSQNDTTKKNNGLQSEVKSHAEDSTRVDNVHDILYLYGKARVTYEDFELDADFIMVDRKNHIMFARGSIDPLTKKYIGRPISKQKKDKPIICDSLRFNYETKKGKLYNPYTDQDGDYITNGQIKKLNDEETAVRNVLFTTCDLPYPDTHFGIVITKGIIEKNRIVSGPAYLEIEGVPLPLAIPFGFFPKPDQKQSGVILPSFGEDATLGFYLRNFGYYLALNDYMDLTNEGTIYSKGSYEIAETFRYLSRYEYQGTLNINYGAHNYGLEGDPFSKSFNIQWSHAQNPNASPGSTFSASVNAGTSNFYQQNGASLGYNLQQLTQNNLTSSISYTRTWAGTPFNFSADLRHSQNITAKTITLELPTFNFNMSTINPFDSKERVGPQQWWQKITVGYSLQGTNKITDVPESQLFTSTTLSKRLQNGFEHQIPIGFNFNLFKYFQVSAAANYTELWYFQTTREHYARGSISGLDSLVTDTVNGFRRAGYYNLSAGLSTKVYSTLTFKSGDLKAIRHVMTPSLSFSYQPDFSSPGYGYYQTVVSNATVPYPVTYQKYSVFQQGVYGGPPTGKSAGIGLSVDNTIEAKLKAKSTDTTNKDRKISILDGLSLSTFYNFAADSFKLAPISLSGHTALFKKKLNINFGGTFNPYVTNVRDSISGGQLQRYAQTINKFSWQEGKFPELTAFNISASASFNSTTIKTENKSQPPALGTSIQNMTPAQQQKLAFINSDPSAYVDFNIPWNVSLNYSFNYGNNYTSTSVTNTIMISGDVKLTDKWAVQYQTNYDLRAGRLSSATSFSIYRNLHCWDLSMQWLPFGYYKSYNVTLKVKSTILQDLKLTKRSDYTSNPYFTP
jgi:hypothetical protein